MKVTAANLASGTRDFAPETMIKRTYLINTIASVFELYGFAQMQTPAIEKLSTLLGKYGEEGDQLLFKLLNSGDFLKGRPMDSLGDNYKAIASAISNKGLRYDLTVPLARYIAQNRHKIKFPFKRYQIQPVWRADRPQKGRYREFYQCDGDIIGGESLFYESEILSIMQEVFTKLGLDDFVIEVNHRMLFEALALSLGIPAQEKVLFTALDKLDKIGWDKVADLLMQAGISSAMVKQIAAIMHSDDSDNEAILATLDKHLGTIAQGKKVVADLQKILAYMKGRKVSMDKIVITPILARGMGYYTGAIFEVKLRKYSSIGSIAAGGRYDKLSTLFGLEPSPSIGFSFGIERIYDVLEGEGLFPMDNFSLTRLLLVPMSVAEENIALAWLGRVRTHGINTELYPVGVRMKKIFSYADHKKIPWVAIIGEDEAPEHCTLKNMATGEQIICNFATLLDKVKKV